MLGRERRGTPRLFRGQAGLVVRVLVTEMLAGRARWVGGGSCALALGLGLTLDTSALLPGVADPFNLSLTAVAYLAPLAAGGSAMATSALTASGLLVVAGSAPRGRIGALAVAHLASLAWHLLAFVVLTVSLCLRSDLTGAVTGTMFLLPLTAVSTVAVAGAVGALCGLRVPSLLAPPAAAVLVFAWIFVGSYLPQPARAVAPIFPEVYYQVFLEPNGALLTSLVAFGAAFCLGVLTLLYEGRRVVVAVGGLGVLLLAVVAFPRSDTSPVELRSAPRQPACVESDATTLCGWPESAGRLPSALDALVRVRDAASPVLATSDTYREPGLPGRLGTLFQIPLMAGDDAEFFAALAVTPGNSCQPLDSPAAIAAGELNGWVQARVDPDAISDPEIRAVVESPQDQQRAWVESRVAMTEACR